jgi:cytochrome c553
MTVRAHNVFVIAGLAALATASPVRSADLAAGQAKAKEVCAACHGLDGNSPQPDYPKLAGQHREYLVKALRDYKSGARKNPIMAGFAAALSKEDMENVSAWFSRQPAALSSKW